VAISDLGGLGAKEGAPVGYRWIPPSLIPSFLPWLAVLLLFLVKSNRCGSAWWIWLPLGCVTAMELMSQSALAFLPSGTADIFLEMAGSLAFGVAAVWLLAPQLARSHRFITFLCLAPTLAGFSLFTFLMKQDWSGDDTAVAQAMLIPLAISVLVISIALTLAGLACRGRHRPLGFYLWLLTLLFGVWLVIAAPFFGFVMITSGGRVPWSEFFIGILIMTIVSFGTLLPFLILSSARPFFRERLKKLLHVKPEVPPILNVSGPNTGLNS
jgi:hypothetical protein